MTYRCLAAAGLSLLFVSCSDPARPPAQAAVEITINPVPGGDTCAASGPPYSLPSGTDAVIDIRRGGDDFRVIDGDKDVDVECRVAGSESIKLRGDLSARNAISFLVEGDLSRTGGTARISSWDVDSQASLTDNACTVDVNFVDDGAIWADFECSAFSDGALVTCRSEGTFIFENCVKD